MPVLSAWIEAVLSPSVMGGWMALAIAVAMVLTRISAPYGRHVRAGWGPLFPSAWSWMGMEAVSVIVFLVVFAASPHRGPVAWLFVGIYATHYGYRSFIYPFLGSSSSTGVPLSVSSMAAGFNVVNGTMVAGALFWSETGPPSPSLTMALGLVVVVTGFAIHVRSDAILRGLRVENGPGYHVPRGFLYRYISCPNYFGEVLQWAGFAIMAGHMGGWCFAVWTAANLVPRALDHHQWYRSTFADYPPARRAIIPGVL